MGTGSAGPLVSSRATAVARGCPALARRAVQMKKESQQQECFVHADMLLRSAAASGQGRPVDGQCSCRLLRGTDCQGLCLAVVAVGSETEWVSAHVVGSKVD
jgi:hypothetical protein